MTLIEVLGEERGTALYSMEWLVKRVQYHLDGSCEGQVWLAEGAGGEILGHTIVRVEHTDEGQKFGLHSTTYVVPEARRQKIASELLHTGEAWMRSRQLPLAVTYTSTENIKLIRLYETHGYRIAETYTEMVKLEKRLATTSIR